MNIPDAKAAVDKEWEKLEKSPAWQMTKAKSKTEVILEAQKRKQQSILLSSQQCGVGTEVSKSTKAGLCSEVTL